MFEDVQAAIIFDDDYRAFGANSHYYKDAPAGIEQELGRAIMHFYGSLIYPSDSLGFHDSRLLLSFEHNTPDNTLPAFWAKGDKVPWSPIFHRARKH